MSEYWFRPKKKGIGAGAPLNWKGWALLAGYLAVLIAMPSVFIAYFGYEPNLPLRLAAVAVVSIPFVYVTWMKTEGGWRRRNDGQNTDRDPSESP